MNSFRNKFELLTKKKGNVDFLLIFETKIDESCPGSSFKINVFNNLCRVEGVGIMLLVREDLPVKVLSVDKGNQSCYVEVILKKTKWLINYSYNPTKNISSILIS